MSRNTLLAGYGRVDITPQESVPLRGYGNTSRRMSQTVLDPLYATCLAFSDGTDTPVLLFALDLCAFGPVSTPRIRPYLSARTGLPEDRILLSCSHTHSAPDLENTSVPSAGRYLDALEAQLFSAAQQALADLRPAEVSFASVRTEQLTFVRRYVLADGTYAGDNYGHFSLSPIAAHESEPDSAMQLLKLSRAGAQDVLLVNFQGHPSRTGGIRKYEISADAVGVLRAELEAQLGCVSAYFTGGSGNLNFKSRVESENLYPDHLTLGRAMAQYALRGMPALRPIRAGAPRTAKTVLTLPTDHRLDGRLADAERVIRRFNETYDRPACTELARSLGFNSVYHASFIRRKSRMPAELPVELNALSIGDASFVLAPYEMFDTNGLQIKASSPFPATFILTCANADFDYIPSALGFAHGGYSADSCCFLPGTGETLAEAFSALLRTLRSGA